MIFYSIHFNRPDFISIQKNCIENIGNKIVVIDNSNHGDFIKKECDKLGIKCHRNPSRGSSSGNPSISHGNALNFTKGIIDYSEDWCIIDHDFFPTNKIEMLEFDIISIPQIRGEIKYLWPGFIAGKKSINLTNIDFLPLPDGSGDTGAGTRVFVENKNYNIKWVYEEALEDIPYGTTLQSFPTLMMIEGMGIHYLNGSSWMSVESEVMKKKNSDLLEAIKKFSNEYNFKSNSDQ